MPDYIKRIRSKNKTTFNKSVAATSLVPVGKYQMLLNNVRFHPKKKAMDEGRSIKKQL